MANRPINSLKEIFKPWNYQTFASYEERIGVLKLIAREEKEIGWQLLLSVANPSDVGHPTHKLRWRMFDRSLKKERLWQEIWDTNSTAVDIMLETALAYPISRNHCKAIQ